MHGDRERRPWLAPVLGLVLAAEAAEAQEPAPPPVVEAPTPVVEEAPPPPILAPTPMPTPTRRVGPIRRAIRHAGRTIHEDFIGDPDQFAEPPLGASLYATFGVMRAKAAPHVFTLYRSDFLVDTATLTPIGAGRMARICGGLRGWCGPVVVEPTPDHPGLAEARRDAVLAQLQQSGHPVGLERVVIGPPVAPGALGTDAGNYYQVMIGRDMAAPSTYTLSPAASTAPGGGGGPR